MNTSEQVEVKERPVPFGGPMVQAVLAGRKTMARWIVKPQPPEGYHKWGAMMGEYAHWTLTPRQGEKGDPIHRKCPYGEPGDRLWVRETWAVPVNFLGGIHYPRMAEGEPVVYRADCETLPDGYGSRWRASTRMFRWASRINLEITSIRVERLQDISEEDARAEGVPPNWVFDNLMEWSPEEDGFLPAGWEKLHPDGGPYHWTAREAFATWWDAINGKGSWEANPWVWAISLRRLS
jgi:hypothetical protein